MNKKVVALVLACVLIFSTIVAGTLAFLYAKTETITNTFTFGNVSVSLEETTGTSYNLIPGTDVTKDPKVTVPTTSEPAWVFVKVTEANDIDNYLGYSVDSNWTLVDGETDVYVLTESYVEGTSYSVLAGNKVTVADDVPNNYGKTITLDITAYAIQKAEFTNAATAWAGVEAELAKQA